MILLEASLRITVVAAIVALILAILQVRASGARHAAWTLVLAAMLLMPVLPSIVPSFYLRVPDQAVSVLRSTSALPQLPPHRNATVAMTHNPALVRVIDATVEASDSRRPVSRVPASWSIGAFARAAYAAGAVLLLLRFFAGWYAAARLVRRASPVACDCETPVRESSLLATPLTVGVLAPMIILPLGSRAWPAEKFRACLAHELAHIRRRDPFVAFVAHLNCCVFWFHPLAWWLERTLAASAEEAADEAAVRAIGDRPRYAEVLLDIADAVRLHGGRVTWQGVGARGTGLIGRRIDRVLQGDGGGDISRARKAVLFASCAAAIVIVVACRQQRTVPLLQPDAEVAAELERQKVGQAFYENAKNLSAAEVDALEASLKRTPEDFDALRKLQIFYQWSGQKVLGWNEMIARRRPHLLWVIEHHPEHNLAMWQVSADADPVTYAQAKQRWLIQVAKPDVNERALLNAAYFFERSDQPLAEQMLLRAKAMATAPARQRALASQLGWFYAHVILGPTDPRDGSPLSRMGSDPYSRDVRRRLAESDDAVLLAAAGRRLALTYRDEDRRRLGKQLLERANQLDPQHPNARTSLVTMDNQERSRWLTEKLRRRAATLAGGAITAKIIAQERLSEEESAKLRDAEPRAVSELSETERFILLPELAEMAYMRGESLYWNKDRPSGEVLFTRSKKYAQDALDLAPKFHGDPDYGWAMYHARVALATHALREGDRTVAVSYMLDAVKVPPSRGLEGYSFGLDGRLVNGLLKAGERETVVEFLERSAALRPAERERLLKEAANIRAGKMPESYQHMVSRK